MKYCTWKILSGKLSSAAGTCTSYLHWSFLKLLFCRYPAGWINLTRPFLQILIIPAVRYTFFYCFIWNWLATYTLTNRLYIIAACWFILALSIWKDPRERKVIANTYITYQRMLNPSHKEAWHTAHCFIKFLACWVIVRDFLSSADFFQN